MLRLKRTALGLLLCMVAMPALAADAQIESIEVAPTTVRLSSRRAVQHLLVSGQAPQPDSRARIDVTARSTFASSNPQVASVDAAGVVTPQGPGATEIVVRYGDHQSSVKVEVAELAEQDPIDFNGEVIAALSKAGCSSGACHGSPQGKNGFRLSLRGFDPAFDYDVLTREAWARRVNTYAPDESLILQKALGKLAHQGGVRFRAEDAVHDVLRTWIAQGCQASSSERKLLELQVIPETRRLHTSHPQQQVIALAHFSDGTVRDVTNLAVFESSEPELASVTENGLVDFHGTAQATILVRYLDLIRGSNLTFVEHDPQFKFQSPPVANEIDRHVFAMQQQLQLVPAGLCSDEVFLRRVYLDAIGIIPTAAEAQRFLDSTDPQKRAKLVDELLQREEFAQFWAMKWADVMRGSKVTISERGVHSFHRWLVDHFREDRPLTEFAREILTGQGNTLNHPEANFYRVARTPEDAAEATAELFLGVRIQCAKCHNHPFEAITQDDYYGLAAFFARVKFKGSQFGRDDEIVYLVRSGEVRHPTRNTNMTPTLFGDAVEVEDPDVDRRELLADWLASADNPYFAAATANRIWFHLFGQGIVEPVDDFRATNPPSNPALLGALADLFVQEGFRIKPVVRAILNSHTYQLSAHGAVEQSRQAAPADRYFTQTSVRMLSAEQTLDAISAATGVPAAFPGYPEGTLAIQLAEGAVDHPFLNAFSKPVRDVICECAREDEPSLSRVIHLLNNPEILSNMAGEGSRVSRLIDAKLSDAELVEQLYLGTMSRRPTEREQALFAELCQELDRKTALLDLQHALLMSNEFLLRH